MSFLIAIGWNRRSPVLRFFVVFENDLLIQIAQVTRIHGNLAKPIDDRVSIILDRHLTRYLNLSKDIEQVEQRREGRKNRAEAVPDAS